MWKLNLFKTCTVGMSYSELVEATEGFNEDLIIGKEGFGVVF